MNVASLPALFRFQCNARRPCAPTGVAGWSGFRAAGGAKPDDRDAVH